MPNHIQNRLQIIGNNKEVKKVLSFISSVDKEGKNIQIDFNKIVPMPEELNVEIHSGVKIWVEICTGQIDFSPLFNGLDASTSELFKSGKYGILSNALNASTAMEHITGKRERKNIKDFSEEDFNSFIQCLKNYRSYGNTSWYEWSIENWGTKWNAYSQNDERNTEDTIYFQTAWSAPIGLIITLSKQFNKVEFQLDYADEDSGSNTGKITILNGEAIKVIQPESSSKEGYEIYFDLHPYSAENYKLVNGNYQFIEEDTESDYDKDIPLENSQN